MRAVSLYEALWDDLPPSSANKKLTEGDVADIRKLWAECGWTQQEIADHFEICQPQVSKIVNRKQWKEV